MRVILLTHNYPRHPGDLPGAFLHPLARSLQGRGIDIRVVAPADQGRSGIDIVDGIPVRRVRYAPVAWETLAYTGRMDTATRDPRAFLALAGMVRALRRGARAELAAAPGPGVIHAHWWFPAGLAAPPEVPRVITLHGTDGRLLERRIPGVVGRRVLRGTAVVSTVSRALAGTVHRRTGIAVAEDAIQGLPLDTTHLGPWRGGRGIVAVARLVAQKRLDLLIDAAALLRDGGTPVPVTIAGAGEEAPRLAGLIQRRGLAELVHLAGRLSAPEVGELLAGADLFVLPARDEGYGLAAAEAVAAGVPIVVCADGGGLVEIADGGAGEVTAAEPAALAQGITRLLRDPEAPERARLAGTLLRDQLSLDRATDRAITWYRRALAAAAPR